ncbi:MAG: hypothetical protein NZ561_01575 [Phycisphaerae bacterium]|nr:hypothetical protein [Phycisphaerae bacterium]MDW8263452.1 hypothetical protein [Phycisphaerales bacterium]
MTPACRRVKSGPVTMRAKYIGKTARRRTIRPDGDHYRLMRRLRSDRRPARRRRLLAIGTGLAVGLITAMAYVLLRGN